MSPFQQRSSKIPFFLRGLFPFPLVGVTRILVLSCFVIQGFFWILLKVDPLTAIKIYMYLAFSAQNLFNGLLWTPITYLFLHSLTSVWHILFNMFGLYILGYPVERAIGPKTYLKLYFISGLSAAIFFLIWALITGHLLTPAVGASGAIMGILTAFAMLYPEQKLYLYFAIPIKARQLIPLSIGMEFIFAMADTNIAWQAHLGGMFGAYLYLRRPWRREYIHYLKQKFYWLKKSGPKWPQ